MSYPVSNLYKEYQDININNYKIIAEFDNLVKQAYESDDFTDVQEFIDANINVLRPTIRTAEDKNELVQFVEDLKRYTIARKNQVHTVNIDINESNLLSLLEDCDIGDLIIYTNNSKNTLKIQVVGIESNLTTIYEINNGGNTYYIDVTADMIKNLADTSESITMGYFITENNTTPVTTNTYTSGYYINIPSDIIPLELKNNDILSFKIPRTTNGKNIKIIAIKINNIFVQLISSGFLQNRIYNFMYMEDGAYYSRTSIPNTSPGFNKIAFYNENGSVTYDNSAIVIIDNDARNIYYNEYPLSDYLQNKVCNNIWVNVTLPMATTNVGKIYQNGVDNGNFISVVNSVKYLVKNNNLYFNGNINFITTTDNVTNSLHVSNDPDNWIQMFILPKDCRPSQDSYYHLRNFKHNFMYTICIKSTGEICLGRTEIALVTNKTYENWAFNIICPLD